MKSMKKRYYIKDLEAYLGIHRKVFFYWEKTGKVPKARREKMSNYRYWNLAELKKLKCLIGR